MTVDAKILRALRSSAEGSVSGADLSHQLGISRAAIWARIEELRSLGYEIEASPHRGYRLLASPDLLHADDLLSRLDGTQVIGRDIRVFQKTTSTNDIIEKLARDGVAEGAVVFAESQTSGRGRLGRSWVSPAGKGLWFSILLRPKLTPQAVTRLTIATATSLARAVRNATGVTAQIKWPNDLLIQGRKVSGILTELSAELDHVKYVIIGIGMNINLTENDLPAELRPIATSLRIASGTAINRPGFAAEVLRQLDADYRRLNEGEFRGVAEEWESISGTLGQDVEVQTGSRVVRGRAESLDSDGALLVRTQHGHLERIMGGDVSLRPSASSKS